MHCPACSFANPDETRFCGGCGRPLPVLCPRCGAESPAGFRFCGHCGAALEEAEPGSGVHRAARSDEETAERRHLTVLFCDLVGSTALATSLDPEELREILREYQAVADTVIARYDGHIAQYLGDGILVYFGYPSAHEDDARRAVRAGLEIVAAFGELAERLIDQIGIRLDVRVGIHTGQVVTGVVGGGQRREQLALGQTPNLAARLQEAAVPGTVVVSSATQALVEGLFSLEPLGARALKGVSEPVAIYRVLGESGVHGRFELAVRQGLNPLVGRGRDLGLLLERFASSAERRGQVVLISGEAGIGKSRLVHTLRERVAHETGFWWVCRCSPFAQNSALHPLIEGTQKWLRFQREDSPEQRLDKLEAALAAQGLPLAEALPLLAAFLSLPLDGRYPPPQLTPQVQKERTLEALCRILVQMGHEKPAVLVMEDLHWIDPSTREFLDHLLERVASASVLVLLTTRPDFDLPWNERPHLTRLALQRFETAQIEEMVAGLTGGRRLPDEVLSHLVERTDGVPLYVEEMTKSILESGLLVDRGDRWELAEPLRPLSIPATLRDSLTARLDRLGTAKEVAQLAAAVGRRFSFQILAALTTLDQASLQRELGRLETAELVYRRGDPPFYVFKHALIQDAAYSSLLRSQRRRIHLQIAQLVEERFLGSLDIEPELLAHHFEEAGMPDRAVHYLQLAGQRATETSAYLEAIQHFRKAIELLLTLPEDEERARREIALRSVLGAVLIAIKGYAAVEVEQAFARARELCSMLDDPPDLFPVLYGLWVFNLARSYRGPTVDFADQLLDYARSSGNPLLEMAAHFAAGITTFYLGDFRASRDHFDRVFERYDPGQHQLLIQSFSDDVGIFSSVQVEWLHVLSGRLAEAAEREETALRLAEQLNDPMSLARCFVFSMMHQHELRDIEKTGELAERAKALSSEYRFPFWLALGKIGHGWVRTLQGHADEGIAEIREGVAFFHAIEQKLPLTYWLGYLVEALLAAGQLDEALATAEEALAMAAENVDSFYEAELLRLKGEILARRHQGAAAEACFRRAVEVAGRRGMRLLELRAEDSLGRLLQMQGQAAGPELR